MQFSQRKKCLFVETGIHIETIETVPKKSSKTTSVVKDYMGHPDAQNQHGIDELRAILLGDDRQAMDSLREQLDLQQRLLLESASKLDHNEERIQHLCDRVGDDEKLRQAIAPVLSLAVSDVEQSNPRPLARAMSPFIVSSIRSEIANSKEAMVEALYPITGRLVSAAVKSSVASMMETVNQRVDEATSMRVLKARFLSWRTGEPVSAYLIPGPGEVTFHSAMLMERDTGAPICHVDPSGKEPQGSGQSNLVSGLLAALSNLTEEVFTGENDELRTLDLNGRKITLRRSLCHMLVVEFVGTLSAEQHRTIDEKFGEIVSLSESNDHAGLSDELGGLMRGPSEVEGARESKKSYVRAGLVIVATALFAWYLLSVWQHHRLKGAAAHLQTKISESSALGAYPIEVIAEQAAHSLKVVGLIPESHDALALSAQWQQWAQGYPLEVSLAAIADAARTKELEQELQALRAENRILRLQGNKKAGRLSLREQIAQLLASQKLFFRANNTLLEERSALNMLRRIARLLMASNLKLKVLGISSAQLGDENSNAERIAEFLRGLGVSENQLEVTSRSNEKAPTDTEQVVLEIADESP